METEIKDNKLIIVITKKDAEEMASVLAYEYISPNKPVLKTFVNDVVNFVSKYR